MTAAIAPSTFAAPTSSPIPARALLNLLIVDDERSVREACREVAAVLGYHTTTAESAEQALRAADSQTIDLVVPGLDAERCRWLGSPAAVKDPPPGNRSHHDDGTRHCGIGGRGDEVRRL